MSSEPDAQPAFDFRSHLYRQTGSNCFDVHELQGGAANYTVRVTSLGVPSCGTNKGDSALAERYRDVLNTHGSVVAKQAPPFLAKATDIPFSPYRQTIEAAALKLFHISMGHYRPFGMTLAQNPNINIPMLLIHDKDHDVIVQSDLGHHPNLYEALVSDNMTMTLASHLGNVIGRFLANMHDVIQVSLSPESLRASLATEFRNDDAESIMEHVISQATVYMKDAGIPDFRELGEMAIKHWRMREKTALVQGDLWFGTLLVKYTRGKDACVASVGICDWEFAGLSHPAADIGQLGAYLHLMFLSHLISSRHMAVIEAFSAAFYKGYFETIRTISDLSDYQRSLVIMHGWELIHAAGWDRRQDMWCNCGGTGVRCPHIQRMVEIGAQLLRSALSDKPVAAAMRIPWSRFFLRPDI